MTVTIANSKLSVNDIAKVRGQLLRWYDSYTRDIPWRANEGSIPAPYHIWLSEIMCQQTTVQAVKPYYEKFLQRWPSVHDLANARQEDVMAAWAGLGYYARARNLHKCAKVVAEDLGGVFPATQEQLKKLPGIGDYTAAAIAAIAFNRPATVVDGNVERVVARFFAVEEPLPTVKPKLKALAAQFYNDFTTRPGDLAQSLMDLGAEICIPKAPRCSLCPLQAACQARKQGITKQLPRKIKAKTRPQKYGHIYWITNDQEQVLFHQRPEQGLLGGMLGLPTTDWNEDSTSLTHPEYINIPTPLHIQVQHTFTHFDLKLDLFEATLKAKLPVKDIKLCWLCPMSTGDKLPSVFKKAHKILVSPNKQNLEVAS
ncbi:MAG: A/G-specific adenine glycosylase [Rhodospirillales bacterium]|nr:A/G-specific adenine glycosylase [Alphaproteobacteria bacterium]MCB9980971.1 A/G-specific adenine glycosylase [Rhodospirillales bacterium]